MCRSLLLFLSRQLFLTRTSVFFFFYDTAPPDIYTLSLHDALPISSRVLGENRLLAGVQRQPVQRFKEDEPPAPDRKSTRLNSSHTVISYAVFCLKKKKRARTG